MIPRQGPDHPVGALLHARWHDDAVTDLAYRREGPAGTSVVLLHAGVADRRMWDPQWAPLTEEYDVLALDLRGFGESATPPEGPVLHHQDVIEAVTALRIDRAHLVACSMGAGVAVEVALAAPALVGSLHLTCPGGSLITAWTPHLRAFVDAERAALAAADLDAAVAANLEWWVDGPHREAPPELAAVREQVARMQRRAFEITADWDVEEGELDPPATGRLGELAVPTSILSGALDLDAIGTVARTLAEEVPGAVHETWPDVAHLPSLEQPQRYLGHLLTWLARQ